ncbi:hypothetical protein WN55_01640 [Dufourea novaeangliae]|uniref:Uncharacterized protein n=1 Tax=Dufourea novaeangliae TaxID=178035 RepID=A0A154PIB9_DUFNO|nr:hypothetical protein WN55_01640 [Dufourea novaeangliae]
MAKSKLLASVRLKLLGTVCAGLGLLLCYRFLIKNHVWFNKHNEAEMYANFIYENYKEKEEMKKIDYS